VRLNFLAGLLVVVWVLSWWGPRRLRIWFVLLAPFGSVALIVAAYLSVPAGSCDHGCVPGWADNVDSSRSLAAALPTFPVSIVIAVLTLPVELFNFLRRNPRSRTPNAPPLDD
jgi:fucose 4-O-acetylase-like acetyltransferase